MKSFRSRTLRLATGWWAAVLALGGAAPLAHAQAIPDSTKYVSKCSGCHLSPLATAQPGTGAILGWSALNVTGTSTQIANAMTDTSRLTAGLAMRDSNSSTITSLGDSDLNAIYAYLRGVRDTVTTTTVANFGSTDIGSPGTSRNVAIANLRGQALGYSFALQGTNAGDFSVAQSPAGCVVSATSGSVGAATGAATPSSCTLQVRFQPLASSAAGARQAKLKITFTSGSSPLPPERLVDLSGTAVGPFQLSTNSLDFGSSTVGTTPAPKRSAVISNIGITHAFTITALTFNAAATAAHYTLAPGNGCTVGLAMAVGGPPCQLDINYAPTAAVASTPGATFSVAYSGATGSPQVITLQGAATAAPQGRIDLSASALGFGDRPLGSSATMSVTLHNEGDATLHFSSFGLSGSAASDYQQGGTCSTGTPLQVGAASVAATNCTLAITFQPTALNARPALLTIRSDATVDPVTIALSGNGVPVPAPQASLSASTLAFGSQTVGGLYPARTVTLTNTGTANLVTTKIAVAGATFTLDAAAACPATLAPAASCDIPIDFNPAAAGVDYAGSLSLVSNAAGSPHGVALTGRGTAAAVPLLAWSPAAAQLDFGLVTAGTVSPVQSLGLLNNGPGGVILTLVNAVGVDASAFAVAPGSCPIGTPLFAGRSCRIDIRYAPGSAGSKVAALQVASNGSAPSSVALGGTGLGSPTSALALSAAALVFDATRVGAKSSPADLSMVATGAGVVTVTALNVSGPFSLQDKTCPGVPFTLQAGAGCVVTLTFAPRAEGDAAGVLHVSSDASLATRELPLSGKGQAAADVSGGGCSMIEGDGFTDPTLWVLALLALAVLFRRERARQALPGARGPRP